MVARNWVEDTNRNLQYRTSLEEKYCDTHTAKDTLRLYSTINKILRELMEREKNRMIKASLKYNRAQLAN